MAQEAREGAQGRADTPVRAQGVSGAQAWREAEAKATTEAQFQRALVATARDYGYALVYHTKFSLGSDPGFPDLILVREERDGTARCVVVECKRVGKHPTARQQEWLDALGKVAGVEAFCWRPDDWDTIHAVLSRGWMEG